MKDDDRFPLLKFDFRKPECQVVVFPLGKRVGKARHIAAKLQGMAGAGKEKVRANYWKARCEDLTAELERRGLPADEIKQHILAFRDAVSAEMRKADAVANQSPRPSEWDDGPRRA